MVRAVAKGLHFGVGVVRSTTPTPKCDVSHGSSQRAYILAWRRGIGYDMINHMKNNAIEPGLLRIFRYFTGIAMIYYAALVVYTAIQTGEADTIPQIQSYVNFGINLILLGYLFWGWLARKLKRYYLPFALITATVVPIFSNLIYLAEPQEDAYLTIMRSWLLFPILIVPLVLIAWQYRFRYVMAFTLFATLVEYSVLLPTVGPINLDTAPILGVPMIRAFAFGVVGHIVTRLIETQRAQRKKLIRANVHLSQHANTLEQLATSRERNRLARELHDTLAHTLSGLAVNLEAIKFILGENQSDVREMLEHALENTREGLGDTRRALKDLRSKQLAELGLGNAVRNLAHDAALRAGFELRLNISGNLDDLAIIVEQCYFRIAQEALQNIVKHAQSKYASLKLVENKGMLTMVIADDGIGFNVLGVGNEDELGLKGMRERAAVVGADLDISSHPGEGTTIHLSMELPYDQSINL